MNDDELMKKTLAEILQGGDEELFRAVMLSSNEMKKRTSAKLADPEVRKRAEEHLDKMFRSSGPKP